MKRTGQPIRASATLTVLAIFAAFIGVFTPTATAQDDAKASSVLIMDASSSMLESDGDGTRMDSAKKAAHTLVDELPDTATMGLVAYGANESDAPDNREAGCKDIETLAPVKALDRDKFHDGIDGLTPTGYTPMGNALRHAADELPDKGERSIILVSDGIDSCAPPPVCEVAEELADEGVGLVVHTVGFHVDEAARKELECISGSTGGEYRQADDADKLAEELQFLAQRAVTTYKAAGTEFEFADSIEDAKWLGEGRYHTRVTPNNEKDEGLRYIRVAVPEGHNAYVTVTGFPDRDATGTAGDTSGPSKNLFYHLDDIGNTSNGKDCSGDEMGLATGETPLSAYTPPEPVVAGIEAPQGDDCNMEQWYLGYDIFSSADLTGREVSIEVQVAFEPVPDETPMQGIPEDGSGGDQKSQADLPLDETTPVTGGTGFADAAEVKPGAYSDTIVPGEYRFYKVPVDWGQRPVVTIRTGKSERGDVLDRISGTIYSPHLIEAREFVVEPPEDGTETTTATTEKPILFNNRQSNRAGGKFSLAGDYYVGVAMRLGSSDEARGIDQPYEIAFDVEGDKVDGPEWRMVNADGPPPSDTPPSDEKDKDAEKKDDKAEAADTDQQAQESEDDGGFNLMWIAAAAGGILVIALIIIVALLLTRRR
ncbi:vWA domain-containing protein [Corynebacterium frankenforstense]|uniref:vWA domain-containing protein n=1 Tax=Corynebacterium frankenforstense TaxID=1230998 RepID=UPI0009F9234F|nr:VWA domain-containing protein [Corynebacterium frankenforstense]